MTARLLGFLAALVLLGGCVRPAATPAPAGSRAIARPAAGPHDAFVLLSGGGSPTSNNYSQYLQAEAMAAFLQRSYPEEAVWTFFGIGNRPDQPPVLADVHRKVKRDGLLVSTWLAGALPRNRPARKQEFLRALREEVLPRVAPGGTLYLFVGDHGELTKGKSPESAITMWQLEPTEIGGWKPDPAAELTVSELRAVLEEGLGRGRVVFCMTQCHSGGFHFLGVPRTMAGNPAWYRPGTAGAKLSGWPANLRGPDAAGFTATDEPSLAAGCAPDPDPDRWSGYERLIPEALLGVDLLDASVKRAPLASFAQAHEAATIEDRTIDKPYGTSDQYLERWAEWIERAAKDPADLRPEIARELAVFPGAMDGRLSEGRRSRAFSARAARLDRFTESLVERYPDMASLLRQGTRAELEAALAAKPERGGDRSATMRPGAKDLWEKTLRPAWKEALAAGEITDVPPQALAFEQFLLKQEERGQDFTTPGLKPMLLTWTYWQSSYAWPDRLDPVKAEAVARWSILRRWYIGDWARRSADDAVRAAGEQWVPRNRPGLPRSTAPQRVNPGVIDRTALERVLQYRRVLGAWAFLEAVGDKDALARLERLVEIEELPLPVSR